MLRTFVATLVLTFSVAPSIGVACKAICNLGSAAADDCHGTPSAGRASLLIATETCDDGMLPTGRLVAEGAPRLGSVSNPDAALTDEVRIESAPDLVALVHPGAAPPRDLSKRPFETALRI